MMKIARTIIRYILGVLFIFSGFVKLVDPAGTAIKMKEYFEVFAEAFTPLFTHLIPASMFFSIFTSSLEVVLGVAILVRYRNKWTNWALVLLMVFFTFLTWYSAQFDKVTDCGCFGDAVKLTAWETFYKNVVFLILISILITEGKVKAVFSFLINDIIIIGASIFCILLALHANYHLPIIDFRPYHIGANIKDKMQAKESPIFEYIFKKDGEEVTSTNYLMPDDGYEFVDFKILNEKESSPEIIDFSVWDDEGTYYTDSIFEGIKFLQIIEKANTVDIEGINEIYNLASELASSSVNIDGINEAFHFYGITSSNREEIEELRQNAAMTMSCYYADHTVLEAMIRSNPGIILVKQGEVIGKWGHNDIPEKEDIIELLNKN